MSMRKRLFNGSSSQNGDEDIASSVNRNKDGQSEKAQEANSNVNDAQVIKKRGRGHSTRAFFACKDEQRHQLQWNKHGQAIGHNGKLIRSACAYYARCHWLWPLDRKWKEMPKNALLDTWKHLEENRKKLEGDVASLKVLVERLSERIEQRDNVIHQQATLLQQVVHYVGFPYHHSYRQNVCDPSGVSGSIGGTNDDSHGSGNNAHTRSDTVQSRRASDADDTIATSSRCPTPFVGRNPTFSSYGYPQTYLFPSFSFPSQVQFSNQHHESQIDTPSHPHGRQSSHDPNSNLRTSNLSRPSSQSLSRNRI